jgi:hypothetical protein
MNNKNYNKNCYINKNNLNIIPFKPEKDPEEIRITEELYKKLFIKDDKIDFNNLKISNIGIYSITRPDMASKICKEIHKLMNTFDVTITDALGNVGGMTMSLAKYFTKVNTCEIIPLHCDIIKNNLQVYNLDNKVNIINDDYMNIMYKLDQDIIFFDPPWGGEDYKNEDGVVLGINNINIYCIINKLLHYAKYILLLIPYNYSSMDLLKIYSTIQIIFLDEEKYLRSHRLVIIKGKKN